MRAGQLRFVGTIQSQGTTLGNVGQKTSSWADAKVDVRFNIEPLSGYELERAKKNFNLVTHRLTLRFDPNFAVDSKMRMVFGERIFNFGWVKNVFERDRDLLILCSEDA